MRRVVAGIVVAWVGFVLTAAFGSLPLALAMVLLVWGYVEATRR